MENEKQEINSETVDSLNAFERITEGAKNLMFRLSSNESLQPGHLYPSKPTNENIYDCSNPRSGAAVIFNQINIADHPVRNGSEKDATDLGEILSDIGFDVKICIDFTVKKVREELYKLSKLDHSDSDCLFVCVMTHGKPHGKIFAADGEFMVQELWENFLGDHCPSLIGKPKLFFIQACRGSMSDLGVVYKPQPKFKSLVNSTEDSDYEHFVIPSTADLLVMFSSSEGYYTLQNDIKRSWFIQALCEELRSKVHEDLMTILTGVNKYILSKQSIVPGVRKLNASKQIPSIMSTLTKKMFFDTKKLKAKI